MQTYLKTKPVWIQLLLFLGMAFGLLIILSLIGMSILSKVTGISILQFQDVKNWDPNNPNTIVFIRGALIIQFVSLFLVPTLLFAYFSDPKPMQYIGLKAPSRFLYWVLGIGALLVAIPFVEYTGLLNQKIFSGSSQEWVKSLEEEAAKQIEFMLTKHTPGELMLNLIFIALSAGVGEELFFRGVLQRLFIRLTKSPWAGIIITAALFSAFHLQFLGFLPRFFLGILLGAIYWYSGSLWTAILAHFVYDGLTIVIIYANPAMAKDVDATITQQSGGQFILTALISLLITILVVWQMKKHSKVSYQEVYKNDKTALDDLSF